MRVGIFGLGFMGSTHLQAVTKIPGAELVAVVSDDPVKLGGDLSRVGGNLDRPGEKYDFSNLRKYRRIEDAIRDRDIEAVDVISIKALDEAKRSQISGIIKQKMGREPKLNFATDEKIGGGVVIKFGSMALDGSIKNLIRESATNLQEEVDARKA